MELLIGGTSSVSREDAMKKKVDLVNWSKEWPTKPGFYWFFGWPYKGEMKREMKPELNSVRVHKISNGTMVTRSGAFWFRSEWGGAGRFIKAEIPSMPDLNS